jgi:hypothetical protein
VEVVEVIAKSVPDVDVANVCVVVVSPFNELKRSLLIVILPSPLDIEMPPDPVRVALVNVPLALPIKSWPLVADVTPVPPFATDRAVPRFKAPAIPTPPLTVTAPVVVLTDAVVAVKLIEGAEIAPV